MKKTLWVQEPAKQDDKSPLIYLWSTEAESNGLLASFYVSQWELLGGPMPPKSGERIPVTVEIRRKK